MGYKSLLDRKLNLAFNLVKDLAEPVILIKKADAVFDFSDPSVVAEAPVNVPTKAVWIDAKKTSTKTNKLKRQVMLKRAVIGDAKLYDSVDDGTVVWTIVKVLKDDGLITLLEVEGER